mmetsp:Transcript_79612/g.155795  ORF Transcript_79612/g.155795 Transcript_79612/m.155795 type:complete len:339 (-) Transcript_79612:269-1285(-)|eukprot:CAMPEP_0171624594 /NCGR_PEP_ID=MMETSP0990-20121206/18727_1 /TAXON_ID=483369 /ORGANISM="non described non described, Strain CCMP2098" /LENGTH=338 /DNA_ID=CAMNT_0012191203 /DNA_START=324 /DNA_END=1340 /DNA_ORIENTATION=-
MASLASTAVSDAAAAAAEQEKLHADKGTITKGKHTFLNLYNELDARHYYRLMYPTQYFIGDHTGAVVEKAMGSLLSKPSAPKSAEPPVVLELCAGYGLSMAVLRTTYDSDKVFAHYVPERPNTIEECIAQDKVFYQSAMRSDIPDICAVGVDIANNAMDYGKGVGIFHETICRNFEDSESSLTASEMALCARSRIVIATGAFSYISCATLRKIFDSFISTAEGAAKKQKQDEEGNAGESAPVFLFFPLVATDVTEITDFFESQGLEVYYQPHKHWLPQRKFMDPGEGALIEASQAKILAARSAEGRPPTAREGHLHATPLIAGPKSLNLAKLALEWCP